VFADFWVQDFDHADTHSAQLLGHFLVQDEIQQIIPIQDTTSVIGFF
jgi:hypothetical protein